MTEIYRNLSYVNPSFTSITGFTDVLLVFNITQVYIIFSQIIQVRGSKDPILFAAYSTMFCINEVLKLGLFAFIKKEF